MSLVGHWKLDGDATDSAGDNDGSGTPSYVDGKIGEAYDANSSSINAGNSEAVKNAFKGSEITLSMWWRQNQNQSSWADQINKGNHRIEHGRDDYNGGGYGPGYWIGLYDESDSKHNLVQNTLSGISQGEWFHIVLRKDMDEMSVWINGEKHQSRSGDFSMGSYDSSDFVIGKQSVDDYIDDIRLYDHAISEKEIHQLSQAKILHYKFDNFAEPTENTFPQGLREMSSTDGWSEKMHSGITTSFIGETENRQNVYEAVWDGSNDGDWYSRLTLSSTSVGEEYVFSREYKVIEGSDKPNNATLYQDGWKSGGTADKTVLFDKPIENGWRRRAVKFTINTAGTPVLRMSTGYTSNKWTVYMDNYQYEKKNHATPFVNGTRGGVTSDCSGYGNHASFRSNSPRWTESSKVGSGAYDFKNSDGVTAENNSTLQLTGDLTISFWAKPFDISSSRQNPINKSYSEEYTMTAETDGALSFYCNDSDSSYNNYQAENMFQNDNEWVHVTAVRDVGNGVFWYRNGDHYSTKSWNGGDPIAGGNDLIVGDGYTNAYNGILEDVRFYASALSGDEVREIYEQRASIDSGGNLHGTEFIESGYDGLTADYVSEWEIGTSGSQGSFSQNGSTSENDIIESAGPFGEEIPLWRCTPDSTSGSDGGWNMDFDGDNSDRLRFSVFVNRTGDSMNGSYYHGCDNNGNTLNLDGSSNGNPYFHSGNLPTNNDWYLLVGILHPNGYSGGQGDVTGVYDLDGNKVSGGTDYKWGTGNGQRMRNYLYYSTDTSERQYFAYPRIDIVDGTEPSISDLVNGLDARLYDHISQIDTTESQPMSITPESSIISQLNEVGPASDSLVGWWPLNGDTLDYSGNGHHAEIRGNPSYTGSDVGEVMEFNEGDGDYLPIRENYYEEPESLPEITISAWVKTTENNQYIIQYDRSEVFRSTTDVWVTNADGEGISDMGYSGVQDGEWHHVVHWYNSNSPDSEKRVYVDKELVGELSSPHNGKALGSSLTTYGAIAAFGESRSFDGDDSPRMTSEMKDVRFYDRALSEAEIHTLYNLTDPRKDQRVIQSPDGEVFTKEKFNETI